MPQERDPPAAGGPKGRGASISETAGGIPDEAIGPGQRSVPELMELEEGGDAAAMAAKLQAEADKLRAGKAPARKKPGPRTRR